VSGEQSESARRTTSVEEALEAILAHVARGPTETIALEDAAGRILAEPIVAGEDLWPFSRAAMDGIAARLDDLSGASAETPVELRLLGSAFSGEVWTTPLGAGEAIRIATGTPIPPGADVVVPQELIRWDGDRVQVRAAMPRGRNIFPAGEDARAGEEVLEVGTVLRGGEIGLLAALGRTEVPVVRRPTVAVLAVGDELVPPSAPLAPGQVRESNSFALAAEMAALGVIPRRLRAASDTRADLDTRLTEGLRADGLVITGGVSVGERDLVRDALQRAGVRFHFVGVAMKPGAPSAFGSAGTRPVFALPGTPGAARVAFELLVRPALAAMAGRRDARPAQIAARVTAPLAAAPGRRRFLWARAALGPEGFTVQPLSDQGTATLRSSSAANALIDIPADAASFDVGDEVAVRLLPGSPLTAAQAGRRRVFAVVGGRHAGKTVLIERLIPLLTRRGHAVAVIKHHAHMHDEDAPAGTADRPGTDTARASEAGAFVTVLTGPGGLVLRQRHHGGPPLAVVLALAGSADIVLVEGYSQSSLPKILVHGSHGPGDRQMPAGPFIATVGDHASVGGEAAPHFPWGALEELADLILSAEGRTREE